MQKTSKIINLLTLLLGLAVAALAYLLIDSADKFRGQSSAKRTELDAARKALAEMKESTERDENSLRARKSDTTDDLEEDRDQVAKLKLDLPEKEIELKARQKQQEDVRRDAVQKRAAAAELEAAIKTANETASRLSIGNPATRAALNQLQDDLDEQQALFTDLEIELRDYEAETKHLASHYASILEGLAADAENPAWITIGKSVFTKIERLSMEAGMLVLPLGTHHGMRQNMRFFVSKDGKRVGQLVIKDAGLAHSVANIVPLVGNPTKLREKDTVEITGF